MGDGEGGGVTDQVKLIFNQGWIKYMDIKNELTKVSLLYLVNYVI